MQINPSSKLHVVYIYIHSLGKCFYSKWLKVELSSKGLRDLTSVCSALAQNTLTPSSLHWLPTSDLKVCCLGMESKTDQHPPNWPAPWYVQVSSTAPVAPPSLNTLICPGIHELSLKTYHFTVAWALSPGFNPQVWLWDLSVWTLRALPV